MVVKSALGCNVHILILLLCKTSYEINKSSQDAVLVENYILLYLSVYISYFQGENTKIKNLFGNQNHRGKQDQPT